MSFASLPPEVNSGLMYAGAGSGQMLAAASVWDGLATEIHLVVSAYNNVIDGLTADGWIGPASRAMATAAAPYVTWLTTTATEAEQTAGQIRAAVAAYEAAHAATIPPAVVAANRAQLATLVATNVLGQNTPAIAANEAAYAEFWAQDGTAMDGYQAASAPVSALAKFVQPPNTVNPAGLSQQAAVVGQAGASAAGTHAQAAASAAATTPSLASATAPAATAGDAAPNLGSLLGLTNAKDAVGWATVVPQNGSYVFSLANSLQSLAKAFGGSAGAAAAASGASSVAPALSGASGLGTLASAGGFGSAMTAGLGQSGTIGGLSVPQSWAAASPLTGSLSPTLAGTGLGASPGIGANAGGLANAMPMLAHAARAAGPTQPGALPRFDLRPSVVPVSPAAG